MFLIGIICSMIAHDEENNDSQTQLTVTKLLRTYYTESVTSPSIPHDLMWIVANYAVEFTGMIEEHTTEDNSIGKRRNYVDLSQKLHPQMSTLFGFDFSDIFSMDLSDNSLKGINDKNMVFDDECHWIHLQNNQITEINLQNTNIKHIDLTRNQLNNIQNIQLPKNLYSLYLSQNLFEEIENYTFTETQKLEIRQCGIKTIKNVIFHCNDPTRTYVSLNGNNQIETMQNIKFINIKDLIMSHCDVTLSKMKNIHFESEGVAMEWDLRLNPVKLSDLHKIGYQAPKGVKSIRLDDGIYTVYKQQEEEEGKEAACTCEIM